MLLALVGFSLLPVVGSIAQQASSQARVVPSQSPQLEAQASGYQMVLEREPENQIALRGLLEIRLKQGDLEGATVPLEQMVQLHPEQTEYAVLLAQVKQRLGDEEGAVDVYYTALARQPDNVEVLQAMVDLLLSQDRAPEAIALLQNTLDEQADGLDASVQMLLGIVLATQKRYDEAIALYDQIRDAHPDDFRPILAKALVLTEQGNDASPLFEQAKALAPPRYQGQIDALVTANVGNS